MEFNSYLLLGEKKYQIPRIFKHIADISPNVSNLLASGPTYAYRVQSMVSEEVLQFFIAYLTNDNIPDIRLDNINEYIKLSEEFQILQKMVDEKKKEFGEPFFLLNSLHENDKNVSYCEKKISLNLDDFLENYGRGLMKSPIQSLYNIFIDNERKLTKFNLAYELIKQEFKRTNNPDILILLTFLDGSKLSQYNIEECFLLEKERYNCMPNIDYSPIRQILEKKREKDEQMINLFNNLEENKQISMIKEVDIINDKSKADIISKFISYLNNQKNKYISKKQKAFNCIYIKKIRGKKADLFTDNDENSVFISYNMIELLIGNKILKSTEMKTFLSELTEIYFDIEYPSVNFDSHLSEIVKLRKEWESKSVKISVFLKLKETTDQHFQSNIHINYVHIDSGISEIKSDNDKGCFQGCLSLTNIEIPSSVTKIDDYSFYGCSSLASIEIPSSVVSIGKCSFYGCTSLSTLSIPSSVTSIGDASFSTCSSLKSVDISANLNSIPSYAFNGCTSLTEIFIPPPVKSIGKGAFFGCSSLMSVQIPQTVTEIGERAFHQCESLMEITIPLSVKKLGSKIFTGCNSLASIEMPEYLENDDLGIKLNRK